MKKRTSMVVTAIVAAVVALGGVSAVVATTAATADTAASTALVQLTATVACDPANPAQSTITWTVWNKRPFEATIARVDGSGDELSTSGAVGTEVPALGSEAPGSASLVQTVFGQNSAALSVAAHWRMDDRTLWTETVTVTGKDCRR